MAEMFTIQCYLQYDRLQQMGMAHFDSWAVDFAIAGQSLMERRVTGNCHARCEPGESGENCKASSDRYLSVLKITSGDERLAGVSLAGLAAVETAEKSV